MIELLAQTAAATNASPIIWAFIFIGIAIVLFFVEIFVPSGGVIALVGALAVIASLVAFFIHDMNTGLVATGIYMLFGPILAWIAFKIWASSPLAKRMILGGIVQEDPEEAMQRSKARQEEQAATLQLLVGQLGETITILRPIGVIRIDGQRIDAMAETGSIEANTPIKVVSVYDNQIKVREIND
jgi:membrane-bound serine protease (ClpP class)